MAMGEKRMTLTFDVSAASFVVRAFGLRVVDGKLKRPQAQDYGSVKCVQCKKVIKRPEDIGGFFNIGDEPRACCKNTLCLVEADEKAKPGG